MKVTALKVFQKATWMVLWVFVVLVLLELALQLGSVFVKEQAWRAKMAWATGHVRVLALGDSNTYGLYLDAEESYPAQLQEKWNQRHSDKHIEVINLGYPGTNTFRLLDNLPELLNTFQPDVVLLMIGFNDFWTADESLLSDKSEAGRPYQSVLSQLKQTSRLYRLYYMAVQKKAIAEQIQIDSRVNEGGGGFQLSEADEEFIETHSGYSADEFLAILSDYEQRSQFFSAEQKKQVEVIAMQLVQRREDAKTPEQYLNTVQVGERVFSLGILQGSQPAGHSKHLENNLKQMLALLQSEQIPTVLLNYPTRHSLYPSANKKIARALNGFIENNSSLRASGDLPLFVDLNQVFPISCAKKPDSCPDLLFYDAHATAKGNGLVAEKVADGLQKLLLTP